MSAASLGMPVQVFPTGPPAPPPPPPQQKVQLATQSHTNGNSMEKKTMPKPSLEPPPIGFRPEIKIPPNPMANLKPTPRPQEKDDFWVEEYRKERSKSPAVIPQNNGTQKILIYTI